jgi:hypothetical protein
MGEEGSMGNPIEKLFAPNQKRTFIIFITVSILFMVVFAFLDAPLGTSSAPFGIVSYELAGTEIVSDAILREWTSEGVTRIAVFSILIDFLFIPTYVLTIGMGGTLASKALKTHAWPLASLSGSLVYGLFIAGILDITENSALLIQISGQPQTPLPQIAFYAAIIKFTLIFIGLVYALYGGAVTLLKVLEK